MNKIKIIDLLNMISKGEELPKKIKWNNKIYISKGNAIENFVDYINDDDDYCFEHYIGYSSLNDYVEIIEEDKKIEKIGFISSVETPTEIILKNKINEIIDCINKEKE